MKEDGEIKGLMGIYDNGRTDISLKDKILDAKNDD